MESDPFVPEGFSPPPGLSEPEFTLEPLGPQHNVLDHHAWTSSMDHIRGTPGFVGGRWPRPMTLEENLADLERHAADFAGRTGFTYTVLDDNRKVIGCVYIYPLEGVTGGADVRSWVTAARAELDVPLYRAVSNWLAQDWPFTRVDYAPRG